jgi:hypothetical protein
MRRWESSLLVLVLFFGSGDQILAASLALRTGDTFTCSTTATTTSFSATGVRSTDTMSESKFQLRILASEVEETITDPHASEPLRKPERYPISAREDGSVFYVYSNGRSASNRHSSSLHLLNEKTAVCSDTAPGYRNAGGGVSIYASSGLCQKVPN